MRWRAGARLATMRCFPSSAVMTYAQAQMFLALAVGFAAAGTAVTGYQAATARRASFAVLMRGWSLPALAAMPFLMFAGPFLIMRLVARPEADARRRCLVAMMCTIVAGSWIILTGTLLMTAMRAAAG
jgi:hypothetical protein